VSSREQQGAAGSGRTRSRSIEIERATGPSDADTSRSSFKRYVLGCLLRDARPLSCGAGRTPHTVQGLIRVHEPYWHGWRGDVAHVCTWMACSVHTSNVRYGRNLCSRRHRACKALGVVSCVRGGGCGGHMGVASELRRAMRTRACRRHDSARALTLRVCDAPMIGVQWGAWTTCTSATASCIRDRDVWPGEEPCRVPLPLQYKLLWYIALSVGPHCRIKYSQCVFRIET